MSANTGLSRRRVANTDDTSGSPRHTNGSPSNGASHAGSAFEGGNKIACDPRDLDQDQEETRAGGKLPRLTIMEEVLLLGLKDKHVRVDAITTFRYPFFLLLWFRSIFASGCSLPPYSSNSNTHTLCGVPEALHLLLIEAWMLTFI